MKIQLSALAAALTLAISGNSLAQDFSGPKTEWGVPDFQGTWRNNTVMPFQRPQELGNKRAYSEEEALQLEQAAQQRVEDDNKPIDPNRPAPELEALPSVGNYDLFWTDRGMFLPTINGEFRTSAIIDPPNGRIPERVAGFRERIAELRANRPNRSDGPEGRGLGERCLVAFGNSSGPVMSPVMYNSHIQIVQAPGYVTIIVEMVHDARIIRITNDRSPASDSHQKWMGDSIGRWDGDTLIVETKNYNPWHSYQGAPTENLTVIETFRRTGDNKIVYGFTVDDPTVYTAQWSGEYPLSRMDEPVYEYACHEGNYGMIGILAGARRLEAMEAEGIELEIQQ
ncbi:MAG: hypothetical protein GKR91_00125 [Pseudomonadales bacterium]|nr:hypothetical protein [Pseudomonadales bacterium]